MKGILYLLIILGCSHQTPEFVPRQDAVLAKMTRAEKYKILRTYRFLQTLSSNSPGRMPFQEGYLPGIPRLGIPSIEFVGDDRINRHPSRDEKTLKLGFVNLIRDFEKTQVFGNFDEAPQVDSIMGPDRLEEFRKNTLTKELKDLDLFLVLEGSQGRVQKYVCAQYRESDEFNCVAARLETFMKQLGIAEDYDNLLAGESLTSVQLDTLVKEVLSNMNELKIL